MKTYHESDKSQKTLNSMIDRRGGVNVKEERQQQLEKSKQQQHKNKKKPTEDGSGGSSAASSPAGSPNARQDGAKKSSGEVESMDDETLKKNLAKFASKRGLVFFIFREK